MPSVCAAGLLNYYSVPITITITLKKGVPITITLDS